MKRTNVSKTDLNGLIQRVKKEAIEAGSAKSHEIVTKAEERAADIIEHAERTADAIIEKAEEEIKKKQAVATMALQQAARDTVLSVQHTISDILDSIVQQECTKALAGNSLETIINTVIERWNPDPDGELNLAVILNKADREALSGIFFEKLKEKVNGEIALSDHSNVSAGFRIKQIGKQYYYDFTDNGIAEIMSRFLNKELAAMIEPIRERDNST